MEKLAIHGGKPIRKDFLPISKPLITEEEINEVVSALKSGWISIGPKTHKFDEELTKYIGSKTISVGSCTEALFLALKVLEVGINDEVIVPTYTFTATANVVEHLQAKPVFTDVEENTMLITMDNIEDKISDKTKAIIVVDFAGQPVDLEKIKRLSKEYQIPLIEDAAHAIGAEYKGKKIGTISDFTAFSFYATKNMTTGDGGAISTIHEIYQDVLELLRLHGLNKDAWNRYSDKGDWYYDVVFPGYKMNLTDIQAALGLVQLRKLDKFIERRIEIAKFYFENLANLDFIELPKVKDNRKHVFHLFPIYLDLNKLRIKRSDFIQALKAENIGTSVHFIPVHTFTYYSRKYGFRKDDFPVALSYYNREISIPIFNGMTLRDAEDVVNAIRKIGEYYHK